VDKQGYYSASEEIAYRELNGEYLIFSGLTRETLVVHPCAFKLIQLLKAQSCTYDEIMDVLGKNGNAFNNDELASFVTASLEQFIDFGVLDQSGD